MDGEEGESEGVEGGEGVIKNGMERYLLHA